MDFDLFAGLPPPKSQTAKEKEKEEKEEKQENKENKEDSEKGEELNHGEKRILESPSQTSKRQRMVFYFSLSFF